MHHTTDCIFPAVFSTDRANIQWSVPQGLACSPGHWPCMDSLVSVLFLLSDFEECVLRLSAAFRRDPHYTRGRALVDLMLKEQPSLRNSMRPFLPDRWMARDRRCQGMICRIRAEVWVERAWCELWWVACTRTGRTWVALCASRV